VDAPASVCRVAIELPAARRPVATFAITVLAAAPPAAALAAAALATAAATGAALRADDLALELARRQGAWRASAATTTPAAGRRRRLACVAALGRLGGCSGDTVTGAQVRQAHTAGGWESDTVSCQVHMKRRKEGPSKNAPSLPAAGLAASTFGAGALAAGATPSSSRRANGLLILAQTTN